MRQLLQVGRQFRFFVGLAVCSSLAMATPVEENGPMRSQYGVYIALDGSTVDCGQSIGECLDLVGDELFASIGLSDDTGRTPSSANYRFLDAAGAVLQTEDFCDQTSVAVPAGATELILAVRALDPTGCPAGVATGTTGHVEVVYRLNDGNAPAELDVEPHECLEPVPATVSIAGVLDQGQRVRLDALVLLDGVSIERGRELLAGAARAYAPLGIDLVPAFRPVKLSSDSDGGSTNSQHLLGQARKAVGGAAPAGFDVVHTLTTKTMNVFGMADCLGGVRYADRAFSVSTDVADRRIIYVGGPAPVFGGQNVDLAAKIAAHEIGHLMGGHHHLGNDFEGGGVPPDGEASTVMASPALFPRAFKFSTINGASLRGHAVNYATP